MFTSTPTPKTWDIPDNLLSLISDKCPNGHYLACSVCSRFDVEERRYGKIKMKSPFWLGYF